ncbi:MAG: hypothetical protein F6J87_31045 [Spirulina sp. SIO3F2]|nr:hypothetical protein [Spirulina sp. SIO3F2]
MPEPRKMSDSYQQRQNRRVIPRNDRWELFKICWYEIEDMARELGWRAKEVIESCDRLKQKLPEYAERIDWNLAIPY